MRIDSQPLLAVIWAPEIVEAPDEWLSARLQELARRGATLAVPGGTAPEGGLITALPHPPDRDGFAAMARDLGHDPGAILFVGVDSAQVNAAAGAGLRSFRYSRLARDVLARRLRS